MKPNRLCQLALAAMLMLAAPLRAESPLANLDDADRAALQEEIRNYLLENPEILVEMYSLLEERQRAATAETEQSLVSDNAKALFEDGFSYVGGNPEGDVTLVEFLDYQCGYCRKAHPDVARLIEEDGNIRWIVKEFPILGPNSELAARAAISTKLAEGDETYARLHEALMTSPPVTEQNLDAMLTANGLDAAKIRAGMDAPEVTRRIAATHELARTLNIAGTPTFVLGDELVRGYVPLDQLETIVANKRSDD